MDVGCTVLVASCDKYADLLEPFVRLFRKYWPDCPFALWLVTETDPQVEGFDRVIACGAGLNWAERERRALKEISTPYVMMLCDDYYLSAPVDTALLLRRFEQMKRFGAANLRLIPNPKPTRANSKPFGEGLLEYRKDTAYCIATQVGFWELGFLRKLAEGKTSIWDFERYGSFEVGEESRPLLVTPTKEFPFLDAVHKGCWETWGVQCLKDNGIDYDFSKRGLPSPKTRLIEGLKAFVFRVVPNNWIVRVQNAFNLGAKEKSTQTLAPCDCNPGRDMVTSSHAEESCTVPNDQWRDGGRVYPFAAAREQAISDLGRIRVLAQELSAELVRTVQHGTGASVRETGLALVAAAKRTGCFIPYSECEKFGDLKRRRSGESEVYAGTDYKTLVKVKDPTAKAAIKRTSPNDWLYEHIVHNVLFPETRYEFVGVTESVGSARVVLRQQIVDTVSFPSEDEIAAELRKKGLRPDERYFYGNALLAVTDVGERSDNVLLGSDGKVCFIDPLIRLKKPATEVIEALVGPLDGLKE